MSNKALSAGSMWLFSHDEKSFIVHGSSDRMVKHSILDSYVLNPEAEIKGGMVLMDFEKSFPMSFDSYINGLCEGIDKITVTIPSDYVDRTVDIRPYKEGLCSLRKTGRYLTIEIHGEYIHEVPRGGLGHEPQSLHQGYRAGQSRAWRQEEPGRGQEHEGISDVQDNRAHGV